MKTIQLLLGMLAIGLVGTGLFYRPVAQYIAGPDSAYTLEREFGTRASDVMFWMGIVLCIVLYLLSKPAASMIHGRNKKS